jgi:hypothetical protein
VLALNLTRRNGLIWISFMEMPVEGSEQACDVALREKPATKTSVEESVPRLEIGDIQMMP